jgi:hypothetical protein
MTNRSAHDTGAVAVTPLLALVPRLRPAYKGHRERHVSSITADAPVNPIGELSVVTMQTIVDAAIGP